MTVFDALSPPVVAADFHLFILFTLFRDWNSDAAVCFVCFLVCYHSHPLSYKLITFQMEIFGWLKMLVLKLVLALPRIINVEHLPEIAILMSD